MEDLVVLSVIDTDGLEPGSHSEWDALALHLFYRVVAFLAEEVKTLKVEQEVLVVLDHILLLLLEFIDIDVLLAVEHGNVGRLVALELGELLL